MNAALQGLFSTLKDEQLNSIKGELAVQLRQMANYITEKKKKIQIHLARLIRNFQICKNHTKWKL